MASKKTAAKSVKAKSKRAPKPVKKPAPVKAAAPRKERLAARALPSLPPLNDVRRRAYASSFSDEQCEDWGNRTKAVNVLADAEKAVGSVLKGVQAGVDGYPLQRLAWLCTLMIELEDSIDQQSHVAGEGFDARSSRNAAIGQATRIRVKLAHGLTNASGGNAEMLKQVADRNEATNTPSMLETSITGLLQLAVALRRTPEGEVLADDAGLTEAFLSSASSVAESLSKANEATYGAGREQDTVETNRVEGRVLRELNHLRVALTRAKERGELVPAFPVLGTVQSLVNRKKDATVPPPAPTA